MMMVLPRRRGGSAWTPAELLTSGRGTWTSFSAGNIYTDAAKTALATADQRARAVVPKAGTLSDYTAASDDASPTLRISDGLEFIDYDGFNDQLTATDASFVAGANSAYICVSMNRLTSTSAQTFPVELVGTGGANDFLRCGYTTSERVTAISRILTASVGQVTTISAGAVFPINTWGILECWLDATNVNISFNGAAAISVAHGWGSNTITLDFTRSIAPTTQVGAIGEIFIRDSLVTGADRTTLQNYMAARVGVTL